MATEAHFYQILLVEDSAADIGVVRIVLRDQCLGHVLHVAKDGAAAIAFIERADGSRNSPGLDLVLLDMHLPRHSGEEVLKRLRSTENLAQTPVIAMTASDDPEIQVRAQKNAVLSYFRKPSRLDEFKQLGVVVREILLSKNAGARAFQG